jgi:GR25 family glycosyltransferase involved in LPS biosynthesis
LLASKVSGIDVQWVEGVLGDGVSGKALPMANLTSTTKVGVIGCWRSHMNVLAEIVEKNITTALIMEDDVDWDVRVKQQLYEFSKASRALTQPLVDLEGKTRFADPSFPVVTEPEADAIELNYYNLPQTVTPQTSPYGDNWDLLWLGHCGIKYPGTAKTEDAINMTAKIPRGRVVHASDETVPEQHWLDPKDNPELPMFYTDHTTNPELAEFYPQHTRTVQHTRNAACTSAYAVTLKAAREMLYYMAVEAFNDPVDIQLQGYCQGLHYFDPHVCIGSSPSIMSMHKLAGNATADSDITPNERVTVELRKSAYTPVLRLSTKLNLKALVTKKGELVDQYPDTV